MAPPIRKPPPEPISPLARHLAVMGAHGPDKNEVAACRAVVRGTASAGQQRVFTRYLMQELCQVGSVPFTGENAHAASFRSGSLAVGIALAMIADAAIMRFPAESGGDGDGDN